ncbi:winged helix-turn-helix domain-containing protein [Nonomuraea angiospora]|uniref:winged helix-turn-helix domain-containing protein n=1 Tax=Nonomuraea angiospora TaxID=46172 RepID=UPI00343DD285
MVDHDGDTFIYLEIAEEIAQRIASGQLRPRRPVPSESQIMSGWGVSRDTARRAIRHLRDKRRLIYTVPMRGSFVRPQGETDDVTIVVEDEVVVGARMPTAVELAELGLDHPVPVVVVTVAGGEPELYPAGSRIRLVPVGKS